MGPGGRGTGLLKQFFETKDGFNARLTAVCDLWNYRRDKAVELTRESYPRSTVTMKRFWLIET